MRDMHEFAVDVRNPLSSVVGVDRNGKLLTAVTAHGFVWVQFTKFRPFRTYEPRAVGQDLR